MVDRFNTLVLDLFSRTQLWREEEGQGTVEYALILAAVVVGAAVVLGLLGTNVVSKLTTIKNDLN